jgi:hypothetical protein
MYCGAEITPETFEQCDQCMDVTCPCCCIVCDSGLTLCPTCAGVENAMARDR